MHASIGVSVMENEVEIPMPGGAADAVLYRWSDDRKPGVIFLPDGIGTRPSQRQMARRLAGEGYTVLLPNIYYRIARPPFFDRKFDFDDSAMRGRLSELTSSLPPEAMERDGSAYVDFLGAQPEVGDGPMGIVGFCFTGQFALRTAAVRPDRIAAAASFHGGGLFKDDPASPHLALPRVKARLYFGHAREDRSMPAEAIAKFEEALARWGGSYAHLREARGAPP